MPTKRIWRLRSLIKNLKKRKFKSIFRYFFDEQYRSDINHMLHIVRRQPVQMVSGLTALRNITMGHSINYPKWVEVLRTQIRNDGYESLEPVKVIWDETKNRYLVVDGNHRLAALKLELSQWQVITVNILVAGNFKDYERRVLESASREMSKTR